MNARKQYLEAVSKEYGRADEKGRGQLLDEAGQRTGLNRKYLIRVLNQPRAGRRRKARKRRAEYGSEVTPALIEVCRAAFSGHERSFVFYAGAHRYR